MYVKHYIVYCEVRNSDTFIICLAIYTFVHFHLINDHDHRWQNGEQGAMPP